MKQLSLMILCLLSINGALAFELPLPNKPHLIVEGHGVVKQVPDIVTINFDVTTTASSLAAAKQSVDKTVHAAIKAARAQNIDEDQINASKIQAHPHYEWTRNKREYKGETVTRQVEVRLTDVKRYNALVDALLGAGINRLQNVTMDFSQRQALENKAMKLALKDAEHQAKSIAKTLSQKLAGVFQVAPTSQPIVMHRYDMAASDEADHQASGLKLGKQALEQRIRVVYLLKN